MKKNKAKIRVNKLNKNPLFITFLNWQGDIYSIEKILNSILLSFEDPKDREIVSNRLDSLDTTYLQNLSSFQRVFKNYLEKL